jgi:hypothetical protein
MQNRQLRDCVIGILGLVMASGMLLASEPDLADNHTDILATMEQPRFLDNGDVSLPYEVLNWKFIGTSYGLGYSENATPGAQTIKNVYLQPEAFEYVMETGDFPEGAMLALMIYDTATAEPPRKRGYYQDQLTAMELAVKDSDRYASGWAYFDFGEDGNDPAGAVFDQSSSCNQCHDEHGDHDNVFTQFYPELRNRLTR